MSRLVKENPIVRLHNFLILGWENKSVCLCVGGRGKGSQTFWANFNDFFFLPTITDLNVKQEF
jgi:hypothetical protein